MISFVCLSYSRGPKADIYATDFNRLEMRISRKYLRLNDDNDEDPHHVDVGKMMEVHLTSTSIIQMKLLVFTFLVSSRNSKTDFVAGLRMSDCILAHAHMCFTVNNR